MALMTFGGQLLLVGGQLTADADCCCVEDCNKCSGTVPSTKTVTISGAANQALRCEACTALNTSHVLTHLAGTCAWTLQDVDLSGPFQGGCLADFILEYNQNGSDVWLTLLITISQPSGGSTCTYELRKVFSGVSTVDCTATGEAMTFIGSSGVGCAPIQPCDMSGSSATT